MKRIFTLITLAFASLSIAMAGDKPVTFEQLPAAARSFISTHFPAEKISYSTVDDDLFWPEYKVVFVSGMKLQFKNNGAFEKAASRTGVPADVVPVQLRDYAKNHYPDMIITSYEVDKNSYEIELSNRLDLKFSKNFNLIEIDD